MDYASSQLDPGSVRVKLSQSDASSGQSQSRVDTPSAN